MGFGAELGMSAAQGAVDSLFGLVLGGINDQRQVRQQERLSKQQLRFDKERAQFGQDLALQMWDKTNYKAQKSQMKKANLSPGLMYGGGGAGGGTVGSGQGAVSAPSAPSGGGEVMGMQLMNAQRGLIEAQTRNVEADTVKKSGVDTELARQQGRMATIAADLHAMTNEEAASQMQARTHILWQEAKAANGIMNAELKRKQAEAIGAQLMNELRQKQTELTVEQIGAIGQEIAQKWKDLEIKQGELDLQRFVKDVSDSTKLTVETISRAVELVGGGLIKKIPSKVITKKEINWD